MKNIARICLYIFFIKISTCEENNYIKITTNENYIFSVNIPIPKTEIIIPESTLDQIKEVDSTEDEEDYYDENNNPNEKRFQKLTECFFKNDFVLGEDIFFKLQVMSVNHKLKNLQTFDLKSDILPFTLIQASFVNWKCHVNILQKENGVIIDFLLVEIPENQKFKMSNLYFLDLKIKEKEFSLCYKEINQENDLFVLKDDEICQTVSGRENFVKDNYNFEFIIFCKNNRESFNYNGIIDKKIFDFNLPKFVGKPSFSELDMKLNVDGMGNVLAILRDVQDNDQNKIMKLTTNILNNQIELIVEDLGETI